MKYVKAFKPSNCVKYEEPEELGHEIEKTRKANVLRYAARQSADLSIFGNSDGEHIPAKNPRKL
jgi:hypothetical protein